MGRAALAGWPPAAQGLQPGAQAIPVKAKKKPAKDELLALANIGPAMRADFALLGINTVAQLAKQDADKLYLKLNAVTGRRHDPCVWDTFAAAIHQAKTGEAQPWWNWTKVRKDSGRVF